MPWTASSESWQHNHFSMPTSTKSASSVPTSTKLPQSTALSSSSTTLYLSSPTNDVSSSPTSVDTTTFSAETQTAVSLRLLISTPTTPPSLITTKKVITLSNGNYCQPSVGSTWQVQHAAPITRISLSFPIVDLDLFDNPASTISTLNSLNVKVICYFSVGKFENWRPDASRFQASNQGNAVG